MSIKNKLNRMKKHIGTNEGKKDETIQTVKSVSKEIPYQEEWERNQVRPYFLDEDYCLIREVSYPIDKQHGKYSFRDYFKAVSQWQMFEGEHPLSAKGLQANDLFFFDTETTGLGGGTGNTIFLLGYAKVRENEVILRQHILPQPGSEVPLYYSFLENVDYNTLVTYNGKSFDWPQVKTRHTLVREHVPKLPSFGHFDLYHGSRRLWKGKLESVKLVNVESEILDFKRTDDVPGFLAPIIFFDFVERKEPEGMLGVLKHNELDILSLITLYTHLSFQILGIDKDQTSEEQLAVGKWLEYTGNAELAQSSFERLLASQSTVSRFEAMRSLSYQYKKQKKYDEAITLWEELSNNAPYLMRIEALIEWAKALEHHYKLYEEALEMSMKALEIEERVSHNKHSSSEILRRIHRLEKRMLNM